MPTISTPCINVCKMADERCIGCGRSLEQIAAWAGMDEAERRAAMERLRAEGYPRSQATES